jgi:predicted dehydrogenase
MYALAMTVLPRAIVLTMALSFAITPTLSAQAPAALPVPAVRLAIAGVSHGHIGRIVRLIKASDDVELVGVFDADRALHELMAKRHGLPASLFFDDLATMLDRTRPQAVAAFGTTFDHPAVVEAAAARGIHVMMEKPLAVSVADAERIRVAATRGQVHVIVNYETTWYPSLAATWELMKTRKAGGDIRKMVAMHGHQGPREIGVGDEFFDWLTDPVRNGGGALFDFGCYGANIMTWLMDDERPLSVTAITQQIKPAIYPRVDDEATILVEYPRAQGIIQASWNWPFNRKDFETYGATGYAIATGGHGLRVRVSKEPEQSQTPPPLPPAARDELAYFVGIVRGTMVPSGLSSLENNLVVTEILDAARESARTGKTIRLAR